MPASEGWYLAGPLIAVTLGAISAWSLWRYVEPEDDYPEEDYGLLTPAALADDIILADQVRRMLADAGIRSTVAPSLDGRVRVLVFPEHADVARRMVGERQEG